uniref:NADH dehydrogenase subunit 2 n=1 Tax=Cheumatopsyche charites TaxID=1875285 RepID=UPI0022DCDFA2|nr:NADH dehydrogenase subunit 2 [Cheumatopsyche charites]UZZ43831.1 NADH dehydrogenase subunit 2 [Cheumatopsyche charites]
MNNSKLMFFILMIFSMFISISANSWINCWMGLEINTFSFLPFIFKKKNFLSSESSIKFFLIQSISSINLMFIIFLINWNSMNQIQLLNSLYLIISISLLFKLGSAPFHFWMISLIESFNWINMMIFFSLQKIPPIILISYYLNIKFLFLIILINSIFGSISGLNQLSIRKIMTYSSIFNFSWMFSAILISENMFIIFMIIYSSILVNLFMLFNSINLNNLNQIFLIKNNNLLIYLIMINLLSLGGMPPFLGFMSKWLISMFLIQLKFMVIIIIMLMSLINLYYYIQMLYPLIFIYKFQIKWMINLKFSLFLMSFISSSALIIMNIFFFIF